MADTRCYKNSTVNGEWSLKDVSENNSVCPGTQKDDGFSKCCGKSAICLPHNICQALNAAEGSSGFYVGSCTDRDYNSPACSNFCSAIANPDIVYNVTAARWQCCGRDAQGRTKCNDPTNRKSKAPAPTVLLENYSASVSTYTASSTSSSLSTSSAIATPTTSAEPESSGISTGAKVGAGVGGAIGGLLVIALIIFLLKWKRRQLLRETCINGMMLHRSFRICRSMIYTMPILHGPRRNRTHRWLS